MNGLLIVVTLIFLISAIVGYSRGFIKIVASLAVTIATIVLVMVFAPHVSSVILQTFPIEEKMQQKCMEMLMPEEGEAETNALDEAENSRDMQIALIENAKMPELFKQLLLENNNEEIYKTLGVTKFSEYIGSYLAKLIADIISFLVVLIAVSIGVRVALFLLGIIEKIPVVGGMNRIAGGAVGLGTGLVIVWVLFIIITLMYDTQLGATCFAQIEENKFLSYLYSNNILMNFITKFRA